MCKVSGRQYNEVIVQNLFERSDRYIEPLILDNNKVAWFQMFNCVSTYAKGAQFITVERQSKTGSPQSRLYL